MTRAIALKLHPDAALAVVVDAAGESIVVAAAVRVPLAEADDANARGQKIAAAIAPFRHGRTLAIAVVPRAELAWQNYDLPPAPADDLPDLVYIQAQRDLPLADDGEGFDFVALSGDEQHPYRVLGAGLLPAQFAELRDVCAAADLKLAQIVPEPLGWLELGRRIVAAADDPGLTVFAAMAGRQAVLWASEDDCLRLLRTVPLPAEPQAESDAAALGGELRRTLLALAQSQGADRPPIHCVYCGEGAAAFARLLSAVIARTVQAAPLEQLIKLASAGGSPLSLTDLAPAAALAAAAAARRAPPLDLLHPRRRPAPPSRARSYVLAGVAAAGLVALVAWRGYRNLQAPLEAAKAADSEREQLAPVLEVLATDEAKAAAIDKWLGESTNLLTELDYLAEHMRPLPLNSDQFKADEDLVLTKLAVARRQLTLNAAAKGTSAMRPVEGRLRQANYRVDRGPVEVDDKAVPGYSVTVSEVVERLDSPAAAPRATP